ncbi:2-amino-4-hydroxy-6-hydroxymethyldihydropteridine diphosphokinase [Halovibrio salipaludis]|jgi:2-amino-4-hydroxy-6-hydroxymethyldihydropteridine diphosphokinase|uniref:2-amino-4-hydroxy-6-hydroxymethyldihydropteridine diphosphokinase n=1 Tax=Halovibrio salipaludis TaxID=2032626 RepID=A0A2A2EXG6_9GAMM|nr:2-amino-4-hydroxy-6-hydroxymethyldihydropteridine diphosphokinase [Halovibrio salipaludis]PAU77069.1 2-amino-4-hydroxy-6-hydroxymethyldihydropteridine diphosphokinase [Halovibrio salipaludis]
MNRVYISIGSNQNTVVNVRAALDALSARFGELAISSVYESEAVGFEGENFLNLVVALNTDEPVGPLAEWLKQVEDDNGRERNRPRFSSRTLDLDVLTYGDLVGTIDGVELPRSEILSNAFVLQPLAEIAPDERHPVSGERYADLWQSYERDQRLWPIEFHWQGRRISPRT